MGCAAQRGKRYAPPRAADRPVHVAEEDVTQVAPPLDCPDEGLRIGEPDTVERRDADIERRMVHEDVNRPVIGLVELPREPIRPRRAEHAVVPARLNGIEQQHAPLGRVQGALDEAVRVGRCLRQGLQQGLPAVVVADHHVVWHAERRESVAQLAVGGRLPAVGQIAAQHAEGRVAMACVDVGKAGVEPGARIDPVDRLSGADQMGIGDLHDLHGVGFHRDSKGDGLTGGAGPQRIAQASDRRRWAAWLHVASGTYGEGPIAWTCR